VGTLPVLLPSEGVAKMFGAPATLVQFVATKLAILRVRTKITTDGIVETVRVLAFVLMSRTLAHN
jgi:hypothetical protein